MDEVRGEPPTLSREGTGIPRIKRMLYGISGHTKFSTLERVATRSLPGMTEAVIGILSKQPRERHAEIKNKLSQLLAGEHTDLHTTLRMQMAAAFEELVGKTFERSIGSWQKVARRLIDSEEGWKSLHGATFMAFCRRSGHWQVRFKDQKKPKKISWNHLIQNITRQKLGEAFDSLGDRLPDEARALGVDVDNTFAAFEDTKEVQGLPESTDFVNTLHMLRDRLRTNCNSLSNNLHQDIEEIRQNTLLEGEVSRTYVALEMQPAYKKVIDSQAANFQQEGKAKVSKSREMRQARIQIIRENLATPESDNIFERIRVSMKKDFLKAVDAWLEAVEEKVCDFFEEILEKFDIRYQIPEELHEEDPEASEQFLSAAKQMQDDLEGPIREALSERKQWELSHLRGPAIKLEHAASMPSTEPAEPGEKERLGRTQG